MAMQNPNSLRGKFLKKFLVGVQRGNVLSESMSPLERRRVIKISSDVALASARGGSKWSQALIKQISRQESNKHIVRSILGEEECQSLAVPSHERLPLRRSTVKSSKILRSCMAGRRRKSTIRRASAATVAMVMQKRRTKMLKCFVPGGESMDELSLLEETADYIVSLRAQVDVMRRLTKMFDKSSSI